MDRLLLGLTNEPPTGQVVIGAHLALGTIPRADVAAVIVAVLADDHTAGHTWDLNSGGSSIGVALKDLLRASGGSS